MHSARTMTRVEYKVIKYDEWNRKCMGRKQLQQLEIIPIGEAIVEFEINPFHGLDNLHSNTSLSR